MELKVRKGETLQLPITTDDETAESVNLTAWDSNGTTVIDETELFVDKSATISTLVDEEIGTYSFLVTVNYADGVIELLPDSESCDGECEYPTIEVCPGLPEGS